MLVCYDHVYAEPVLCFGLCYCSLLQILFLANKSVLFPTRFSYHHRSILLWCIVGLEPGPKKRVAGGIQSRFRMTGNLTKRIQPWGTPEEQTDEWTDDSGGQTSFRYYYNSTISTMGGNTNHRWVSRYNLNFIRCSPTPRRCPCVIMFLMVSSSMTSVETEETAVKLHTRRQMQCRETEERAVSTNEMSAKGDVLQ